MCTLNVKYIDETTVLKILKEPKENAKVFPGCGIKAFVERASSEIQSEPQPLSNGDSHDDLDIVCRPLTLIENGDGAQKLPGFRTPNKKGRMMDKADSAIKRGTIGNLLSPITPKGTPLSPRGQMRTPQTRTPKTPGTPVTRAPRTPRTPTTPSGRSTRSKLSGTTPTSRGAREVRSTSKNVSSKIMPNTPSNFRAKVKKRIARVIIDSDEDSEEVDDSDRDETYLCPWSEEEEEELESTFEESEPDLPSSRLSVTPSRRKTLSKSLPRTPIRTPRRGREHKVDVDMAASADDYFMHNSEGGNCVTSDHTLNKLENPRLGPEALKVLLEDAFQTHVEERLDLLDDHATLFTYWMTILLQDFSVFLCGVGSKKQLLSRFQREVLAQFDHVVINGFFPSLTVKTILSTILEDVMSVENHSQIVSDQLRLIDSHYRQEGVEPLFLLIHNLDGPMLRNEKAQATLSQLASFSNVHLIASLDHINSPLLFDQRKLSAYNPLWWDATTLAPYTEETSYENSLLVQQTGALALSSLLHVFQSLTPNAKGIFLLLAKHQLSEKENSNYTGFSFVDLYQRCREQFLVSSDLTLRAQLTEFKDHKLIKMKKGYDGVENLLIPLKGETLQEFLDQQES